MDISIEEKKAIAIIKNYLNVEWDDEEILLKYDFVVAQIIENATAIRRPLGVNSITEGKQSMSFDNTVPWSITDDIKAMLPKPFIKMFY